MSKHKRGEVCKHGGLARSCSECDDARVIEALRKRLKAIDEYAVKFCEHSNLSSQPAELVVMNALHECRERLDAANKSRDDTLMDLHAAVANVEKAEERADRLREALKLIAIEGQDDRPLPGAHWDDPFDWRARSMKQEKIAREAAHDADGSAVVL